MNPFQAFLSPAMFALLGLIPLVILMYLLKLKRRNVLISSTLLWQRSIQDLSANAPFQKLRKNLLLFLQILILLFLIFALTRPFIRMSGPLAERVILLIDNSASMQATDVEPTRMAKARDEALKVVGNARGSDLIMVVTFADKPQIRAPFTSNKDELRRAIEAIESVDSETNIADALRLALELVKTQSDATVRIISDGALSDLPDILIGKQIEGEEPIQGIVSEKVSLQTVGRGAKNVGITEADVREVPGQPLEKQVFVRVENTSGEAMRTLIDLYEGESLIDSKEATLEAGGRTGVLFSNLDIKSGIASIRLDVDDDFDRDNEAWVVLSQSRKARALLVTTGNPYLENVLAKLSIVDASKIAPVDYNPEDQYDVVIFDSWEPKSLGRGNFFFWNAAPPITGVESQGVIERPILLDWHRTHPINRFLRLEGFTVENALATTWPPEAHVLLEAKEGTMMAAMERDDRRIVYVAFDTFSTDWARKSISFPVFVSNSIQWLIGVGSESRRDLYHTGESIPLLALDRETRYLIETPDGRTETLTAEVARPAYFTGTQRAGLYRIRTQTAASVAEGAPLDRTVAVNLLSRTESQIGPREKIQVGADPVKAIPEEIKRDTELWPHLALLGFLIVLIEWFVYSKRVWI